MSVMMALRTVLKMHTVLILMEATLVPVHLGILEMELSVMVGVALFPMYNPLYNMHRCRHQ